MKLWRSLAICPALAMFGLALTGCPGADPRKSSESPARRSTGSKVLAGEAQENGGKAKPSKVPRNPQSGAKPLIREKLKSIIIPKVAFEDTPIEEAIDFVRLRTRELDPDPDPTRRGVSFVIRKPLPTTSDDTFLGHSDADVSSLRIKELNATNISVSELLHRIAREFGMEVEITDVAVAISLRE
jgi:hypothetical protein